jgi:hypothetical protein
MQNGKAVAAAVVAGYLLGRTKKMKLALMLGAAAMGSRLDLKSLATKGTALLEASPGAQRVASEVRNRVGASGKAVVGAMASKGMDALSDTLQRSTDRMRPGGPSSDAEAEEEPEEAEEPAAEEQEQEEEQEEEKPRRRRRSSTSSSDGSDGSSDGSGGRSRSGSKTTTRKRTSGTAKRASGSRQRRSRTSG